MQTKKGQSIEDASMKMIEDEIGSHNYNEKEWPIVRRIIHSTADFDFADKNSELLGAARRAEGELQLKSLTLSDDIADLQKQKVDLKASIYTKGVISSEK